MFEGIEVSGGDSGQAVVGEVEMTEVGQAWEVERVQPAQPQPEVHQQPVLRHVARQQARAPSLQEPQLGMAVHPERAGAEKRQAVARAAFGTGGVTVEFIVAQWTLVHAVAQVVGVQAHCQGPPTAVPASARVLFTPRLVFPARAVIHTVTAQVQRQAVAFLLRTPEMSLRAPGPRGHYLS